MSIDRWHIQLFGVVTASRGEKVIHAFRSKQTARLLACLAYRPDHFFRRDELIDMIWPDADPLHGRNRLSVALSALRRELGDELVRPHSASGNSLLQLDGRMFTTDTSQFEKILQGIDPQSPADLRIAQYEQVLALYRGELLPGVDDEWTAGERQRLAQRYLTSVRTLSKLLIAAGRHEDALEHVRHAIQYEPLREDLHRLRVQLLCALGRRSEALTEHSTLVDRLKHEFGIAPSAKTTEIINKLLFDEIGPRQKPQSLDKSQGTASRAKWLQRPEWSPDGSPLFGRDECVFEVSAQLRAPDIRLVSLTGLGGMGKSRLAYAISATLADVFGDDRWFVPLAEATEPRHIEQAILRRMGIRVDARSNAHLQVIDALDNRPTMLVLDNLEQILPAGAAIVRSLLDDLPQLKCIVTSRQRLNLSLEREYPVPPLQTPALSGSPHRLVEFPSVQLFLHCAALVSPGFDITSKNAASLAAICHHLEGLPLAIEMAAAWTRVLSPAEILERLTPRLPLLVSRDVDAKDRHASVRRTLECSFDQMPTRLQRLFARLSVFRGGWSAAAADAVGDSNATLLDLMELRDRSLLAVSGNADAVRNSYLEMVREFAAERLEEMGEGAEARNAHARFFLQLAETAKPHLRGPEANSWLDTLDAEQDNLRQALRWTLGGERGASEVDCGVRLAASLWHYWLHRGYLLEGIEWLNMASERGGETEASLLANVKLGLGYLSTTAGCYEPAQTALTSALSLFRKSGDIAGEAHALNGFGNLAFVQGDWETARSYYEPGLQLRVALGDEHGEAGILSNLASVSDAVGDTNTAMLYFDRCLAILRSMSDTHTLVGVMVNSAATLLNRGDLEAAQKRLLECIELSLRYGYPRVLAHCFEAVAEIQTRQSRPYDAAVTYASAASIRARINAPPPPSHWAAYAAEYDRLRDLIGAEAFEEAWLQGSNMPDDAVAGLCITRVPEQFEREPAR